MDAAGCLVDQQVGATVQGLSASYHLAGSANTAPRAVFREPQSRDDFSIALFCALPKEAEAVAALFESTWDAEYYGKAPGDKNIYTLGRIGGLNVVLCQPSRIGKISAAAMGAFCDSSFGGIKLALLVGICGGVPSDGNSGKEMVLGDIVISERVIEYDFGRQEPGLFVRKDGVEDPQRMPGVEITNFLARLKARSTLQELHSATWGHLENLKSSQKLQHVAAYPGVDMDILYESSYVHRHREQADCPDWTGTCGTPIGSCVLARMSHCAELPCDHSKLVARQRLQSLTASESLDGKPMIHFGTIGSGDTVMKSGQDRDRIAGLDNIVAFEMEGAGLWNIYPSCLVIKAICDYADSHKSKVWQDYARATAGACMVAVLSQWENL